MDPLRDKLINLVTEAVRNISGKEITDVHAAQIIEMFWRDDNNRCRNYMDSGANETDHVVANDFVTGFLHQQEFVKGGRKFVFETPPLSEHAKCVLCFKHGIVYGRGKEKNSRIP